MDHFEEVGKIIERTDGRPVVTVILGESHPEVRKTFRCVNCGAIVFHYYSEVRIIVIGEMRDVVRPVDILCGRHHCDTVYRIS